MTKEALKQATALTLSEDRFAYIYDNILGDAKAGTRETLVIGLAEWLKHVGLTDFQTMTVLNSVTPKLTAWLGEGRATRLTLTLSDMKWFHLNVDTALYGLSNGRPGDPDDRFVTHVVCDVEAMLRRIESRVNYCTKG